MTVAHSGRKWRLAPSLIALEAEMDRLSPSRSTASDGSVGDLSHKLRRSDHNPSGGYVHAIDITDDPRRGVDISAIVRQIAANNDPRVEYLISDGQIWERGRGWRRYTGSNPHRKHGHISIRHTSTARNDVSSWIQNVTVAPPPLTQTPIPAPVLPPTLFAPEEDDEMRIIQHTSGAARLSHGGLLFDLTAESYRYYKEDRRVQVDVCNQAAWDMEHACHANGNNLKTELRG